MADIVIPSQVAVKDPTEAASQNTQTDAISNLNTRTSSIEGLVLPNGSFEQVSSGEPVLWTVTNEGTGATHEIDATTSADGLNSLKCTVNATGGYVEALNDTLLPVYPGARVEVPFWYKSTVATCRVRANIVWLDAGESVISEVSAFDSSSGLSSSWDFVPRQISQAVAPATTAWMQIRMIAGDGTVAGVVHLDSVRASIFHGFVGCGVNNADQPLDTVTQGAVETERTVTPETAMPNVFTTERPTSVLVRFTETSTDMVKFLNHNGGFVFRNSDDGFGVARQDYLASLKADGTFNYRTQNIAGTVTWYLIGYYV